MVVVDDSSLINEVQGVSCGVLLVDCWDPLEGARVLVAMPMMPMPHSSCQNEFKICCYLPSRQKLLNFQETMAAIFLCVKSELEKTPHISVVFLHQAYHLTYNI